MRLLAIETATAVCSVALFDGDRLVANAHEVVGRGHAERLVPMIAALPDRGRADRILVDCGPGSFTGVRVGLAAARALGLAWGVPVAGFSSTALIAAAALAEANAPATLAVVLQAGHGEYFVQRFAGKPMRALSDLLSAPPEAARAACADAAAMIGNGAPDLADGNGRDALPDARAVALLPPDFARLPAVPIYGRAPDARLPGS